MYTNMTTMANWQPSAAKALKKLKQNEATIKIPIVEYLVELLKILLDNNIFELNGHLYEQLLGVSTGAIPSPEVCDLRLIEFDKILWPQSF